MPVEEVELRGNWDVLGLAGHGQLRLRRPRRPRARGGHVRLLRPDPPPGRPDVRPRRHVPDRRRPRRLRPRRHPPGARRAGRRRPGPSTAWARPSPLKDSERFLYAVGQLESRFRAGRAWVRDARRRGRGLGRRAAARPVGHHRLPPGQRASSTRRAPTSPARPTCSPAPRPCATARSSAASATCTPAASTSSPATPPPSTSAGADGLTPSFWPRSGCPGAESGARTGGQSCQMLAMSMRSTRRRL